MTLHESSCLLQDGSGLKAEERTALSAEEALVGTVRLDTMAMEAFAAVEGVEAPAIYRTYQARAATRQDRTKADITQILLHTPEGGTSGTLSVLSGGRAGYDFFLPPAGELYKCNDFYRYIAWQAGDWPTNQRSIGIEQWDYAANMHKAPASHYDRLARLVAYLTEVLDIRVEHATKYGQPGLIYHRTVTPGARCDPDNCGKSKFDIVQLIDKVKTLRRGGSTPPVAPPSGSVWHRVSVDKQQVAAYREEKGAKDLVASLKKLGVTSAKYATGK